MSLDREWRDRVKAWRAELSRHIYVPLTEVELEGFVTKLQLTVSDAAKGKFEPTPPGTCWGDAWQYGWFRCSVDTPTEAVGERLVIKCQTGGNQLVFVDGVAKGSIDKQHDHIVLAAKAEPDRKYELLIEAYAGHGPTPCHAGPTPPDRRGPLPPAKAQKTVGKSSVGIWQEVAYQLHMDVETLWQLRENLPRKSMRLAEIDAGLKDFTLIADFELAPKDMIQTLSQARDRLRPLLECVNGSTAPTMYCFGHGHIDTAWLWPIDESVRKVARTLANQLTLIDQYDGYKFLFSQPQQYVWLKEHYGELYDRLRKAVSSGRVIAEGATWVEPDTNIPSGESLVRQFMHGKRFFRDEFGIESELLWLPDAFGYSGAIPQIMSGCGVKYFSTSKIFWTYHGGERFPYHDFWWEGIDGTKVLAHMHSNYNSHTDPNSVIERWTGRVQPDGMTGRLLPFGWGDGGGGPERDHLEYIARMDNLEGCPCMRHAAPAEFLEDLTERGTDNTYVGEIYFQAHRGVLTSQARTKAANRRAELALRDAEMWGALAGATCGFDWPGERIDHAWKKLLTNQFHDILPGSSIAAVYDQAERELGEVTATANRTASDARDRLATNGKGLGVFNSLNWRRIAMVELPDNVQAVEDQSQRPLQAQEVEGKRYCQVEVPSCGWAQLRPVDTANNAHDSSGASASARVLENSLLRVEFNDLGELVSFVHKQSGREFAAGKGNCFRMFKDVPTKFDAWDIDSMYSRQPVQLEAGAEMEIVANGPLVATIRMQKRLGKSELTQDISLHRNSARLNFDTTIQWREDHKLLKVAFPLSIHTNQSIHEIQFGHIRRANHYSRPFDSHRFEVCNHKWTALAEESAGAALINDCKYGLNVLDNTISLTLLRAPLAPDTQADRGLHKFTYALYCWTGSFAESGLVRQGYELNCPLQLCQHAGGGQSLLAVDADNIVIEAVKPAEDGSGDIIVRLYESARSATECNLSARVGFHQAELTDMLERPLKQLDTCKDVVPLHFRAFEIKTVRLRTTRL